MFFKPFTMKLLKWLYTDLRCGCHIVICTRVASVFKAHCAFARVLKCAVSFALLPMTVHVFLLPLSATAASPSNIPAADLHHFDSRTILIPDSLAEAQASVFRRLAENERRSSGPLEQLMGSFGEREPYGKEGESLPSQLPGQPVHKLAADIDSHLPETQRPLPNLKNADVTSPLPTSPKDHFSYASAAASFLPSLWTDTHNSNSQDAVANSIADTTRSSASQNSSLSEDNSGLLTIIPEATQLKAASLWSVLSGESSNLSQPEGVVTSKAGFAEPVKAVRDVAVAEGKKAVDTVRGVAVEEATKAAGPFSKALWFLTSSKEEKKEAAAKAAVKAALSWLSQCQQKASTGLANYMPRREDRIDAATSQNDSDNFTDQAVKSSPSLEILSVWLEGRKRQLQQFDTAQSVAWFDHMQQQIGKLGPVSAFSSWVLSGSGKSVTNSDGVSDSLYMKNFQATNSGSNGHKILPAWLWFDDNDTPNVSKKNEPSWSSRLFSTRQASEPNAYNSVPMWKAVSDLKPYASASKPTWFQWLQGSQQQQSQNTTSELIGNATAAKLAQTVDGLSSHAPSVKNAVYENMQVDKYSPETSKKVLPLPEDGRSRQFIINLFGNRDGGKEEQRQTKKRLAASGLRNGAYWWDWHQSPQGLVSLETLTPMNIRHVHLDCDPVTPFKACIQACQKDSASSPIGQAVSTERTKNGNAPLSESPALDSYAYGNLRSCYLKCKQKWLDSELPGCLTAGGVKVEGVPPAQAFRSTTSSTTTTTSGPRTKVEKETTPEKAKNSGLWTRLTGASDPKPDSLGATNEQDNWSAPPEAQERPAIERKFSNLFGYLPKENTEVEDHTSAQPISFLRKILWSRSEAALSNALSSEFPSSPKPESTTSEDMEEKHDNSKTAEAGTKRSGFENSSWWPAPWSAGAAESEIPHQSSAKVLTNTVSQTIDAAEPNMYSLKNGSFSYCWVWRFVLICSCFVILLVCLLDKRARHVWNVILERLRVRQEGYAAAPALMADDNLKSMTIIEYYRNRLKSAVVSSIPPAKKEFGTAQPLIGREF